MLLQDFKPLFYNLIDKDFRMTNRKSKVLYHAFLNSNLACTKYIVLIRHQLLKS
ncbi:hypothetical protein BXY85_3696 [Roseivirga pacifica]|uniref:Uncharacterized protein n=1 Tax=Roseivirga pacifica TaxID=1267423 RepID=A0A1I0QBV8_9BACT|nr:hypothetical protein BXY85_3696 [Roseivirga pacifica]SEW24285.1 hypothetical protein SAMN05216290_2179 [Roseivirga pacifica]